jgi:hypothetical protein
VKRSSFEFLTHLQFSKLDLQIWKTLCKSWREFAIFLSAVAIFQREESSFQIFLTSCFNFLTSCSAIATHRTEQNRKLGTCNRKLRTSNRNWGKFILLLRTLQIPSRDLQGSYFAREFFKFAKVMTKIAINLGTQKRNASRSLLVKGNVTVNRFR